MFNVSTNDEVALIEVQLDEFTKARRVVVTSRLGVTEGLEEGIGGKDTRLQILDSTTTTIRVGEVPKDVLGCLGLSGTGLTTDNDTLAETKVAHVTVCLVSCKGY